MNKGLPLEARAAVLLVDDELVRILTVQALEEAGFRVEEAGNSDEALSRLDGHPIVALVTDIDMPGSLDGSPGACVSCSHRSPYSSFPERQHPATMSYNQKLDF